MIKESYYYYYNVTTRVTYAGLYAETCQPKGGSRGSEEGGRTVHFSERNSLHQSLLFINTSI